MKAARRGYCVEQKGIHVCSAVVPDLGCHQGAHLEGGCNNGSHESRALRLVFGRASTHIHAEYIYKIQEYVERV